MPQSAAIQSVNAEIFERAVHRHASNPGDSESITDMMRLACEGLNPTRRRWAAAWLFQHCNVRVLVESDDAAPAPAACLC